MSEKIRDGQRISSEEALWLYREAPVALLGALAYGIKLQKSGREVYYNRNFHIEPTNKCVMECRFCSYHRRDGEAGAWELSPDEMTAIAEGYRDKPVTEVHIVGGVYPQHGLDYFIDLIKRIKAVLPRATVKAFTAVELSYMIEKAGFTLPEGLSKLKEAGMEAIPGGGAEIFDAGVRARICPDKCDAATWLEVHRQAHRLGMTTNASMLYGHVETPEHRIAHMAELRELQDETGGFNAFIPLKFRSANNSMSALGEVGIVEDMRTLALSRIFLDNFDHIKAYWPMYGKVATEMALSFGADDIDGTIDDTTRIYSLAGAEDYAPAMTPAELERMARAAGLEPVERDTFYRKIYN